MAKVPERELYTGEKMPGFGFGTWQIPDGQAVEKAVKTAIDCGYRLIDTAKIYGNEQGVGQAVKESSVPREEMFVTTKLWNGDQGYHSARKAFEESLEILRLEYIDLYLIHWPGYDPYKRKQSWKAFEDIYSEGLAKAIGVSNFEPEHLDELLSDSTTVPMVNQIEFHPFNFAEQQDTLEYCQRKKIIIEAYSPLARGRLMDDKSITDIAKKYSKTNAQVMLRWAVQHGTVPIPKSAHPGRIKENIDIFDFELDKSDMQALNALA